jgi:hypothetical protein
LQFRQPEIQHLGVAGVGDEEVRRFDVSMHDPLGMGCRQGVGDLATQPRHLTHWHRSATDPVLQGLALHQLHGDVGLALVLPEVVDGADVRMIQRRGRPGLAAETLQGSGVVGQLLGEEPERHAAAEMGVLGLVHHPHPSTSELLEDRVVGDRGADHR